MKRGEVIAWSIFVATVIIGMYVRIYFPQISPNEFVENMWLDIVIGLLAVVYLTIQWSRP
jgi:hypothetical protein